jgi:hypothetical protein
MHSTRSFSTSASILSLVDQCLTELKNSPVEKDAMTFWQWHSNVLINGVSNILMRPRSRWRKAIGRAGGCRKGSPTLTMGSGSITPGKFFEITIACRWVSMLFGYRTIRIQHLDSDRHSSTKLRIYIPFNVRGATTELSWGSRLLPFFIPCSAFLFRPFPLPSLCNGV